MAGKKWTEEAKQKNAELRSTRKKNSEKVINSLDDIDATTTITQAIKALKYLPADLIANPIYPPIPESPKTIEEKAEEFGVDSSAVERIMSSGASPDQQAAALDALIARQARKTAAQTSVNPFGSADPKKKDDINISTNKVADILYDPSKHSRSVPVINEKTNQSITDESSLFLVTEKESKAVIYKRSDFHVIDEISEQKRYAEASQREIVSGRVGLLFPTMKDTNPATAWALVQIAKRYGDKIYMDMESGDSMIVNSRNKLANRFLDTNCEYSVWLDDDMIPPTGNPEWFRYMTFCDEWSEFTGNQKIPDSALAVPFIDRLVSHGKSIVGATYVGRQLRGRPMFHEGVNTIEGNRLARNYPGTLEQTDWVGTGCLLVHRQVYIDMKNAYPELAPTDEMPQWDFFRLLPGRGEDASFCTRAKKIGHQPFVDLGLYCAHVGKASYGPWNTTNKQIGV